MASASIPLLGSSVMPDVSGDAYQQPYDINNLAANRRHGILVLADTATRVGVDGAHHVPDIKATIATATLFVLWSCVPTTGNFVLDFDYRVVDENEDTDNATWQQTVTTTVTPAATTRYLSRSTIALTAANFGPNRLLEFFLARDGVTEGGGGIADAVVIHDAYVEISD